MWCPVGVGGALDEVGNVEDNKGNVKITMERDMSKLKQSQR
jgi:hypothetical protein